MVCISFTDNIQGYLKLIEYIPFIRYNCGCKLFGCRLKSNCHPKDLGLKVKCPEVFLRDPNPYLCEFQRKPRKTSNG